MTNTHSLQLSGMQQPRVAPQAPREHKKLQDLIRSFAPPAAATEELAVAPPALVQLPLVQLPAAETTAPGLNLHFPRTPQARIAQHPTVAPQMGRRA